MHLFFATQGAQDFVNLYIKHLSTFPMDIEGFDEVTQKKIHQRIFGTIRPVQLWSFVFPEPYLPAVLKTMNIDSPEKIDLKGKSMYIAALRKMLGADKIPDNLKYDGEAHPIPMDAASAVHILPIGIKKDEYKKMPLMFKTEPRVNQEAI